MPADASPPITRRSFLGIDEEAPGHISSLVVRAHPNRLAEVSRRIARLSVAEVAMSDPSGKLVVTLETHNEDEIVAASGFGLVVDEGDADDTVHVLHGVHRRDDLVLVVGFERDDELA